MCWRFVYYMYGVKIANSIIIKWSSVNGHELHQIRKIKKHSVYN